MFNIVNLKDFFKFFFVLWRNRFLLRIKITPLQWLYRYFLMQHWLKDAFSFMWISLKHVYDILNPVPVCVSYVHLVNFLQKNPISLYDGFILPIGLLMRVNSIRITSASIMLKQNNISFCVWQMKCFKFSLFQCVEYAVLFLFRSKIKRSTNDNDHLSKNI